MKLAMNQKKKKKENCERGTQDEDINNDIILFAVCRYKYLR